MPCSHSKNRKIALARVASLILICIGAVINLQAASPPKGPAIHVFDGKTSLQPIREWIALGPFLKGPDAQYSKDFLTSLGGEAKARLTTSTTLKVLQPDGKSATLKSKLVRGAESGFIGISEAIAVDKQRVAYLYTTVWSDRPRKIYCLYGSGEGSRMWFNGQLAHEKSGSGTFKPHSERFPLTLRKGANDLLLKLDQNDGPWFASLGLVSEAKFANVEAQLRLIGKMGAFCGATIKTEKRYVFDFAAGVSKPAIEWDNPQAAKDILGDKPLKVRWFDARMREVDAITTPGRYTAYAEASMPDGSKVRRALTCFYRPANWDYSKTDYRAYGQDIQPYTIKDIWEANQDGAILLAGLSEVRPLGHKPTQLDSLWMMQEDYQLALKRKILAEQGLMRSYPPLRPPRKHAGAPATILHQGTAAQAGMTDDAPERIRAACQTWLKAGGQPFTVMVARHGVVFFHEAFAAGSGVTLQTKFHIASLTKGQGGLMMTQFLDQGLIHLDDPVGLYLPDFPVTGKHVLTMRHLVTHTGGFEGHGNWGGMNNPWLDNVMAINLKTLHPGEIYIYNGMGFDLAAKVMEIVSGKSAFRLMHENLFQPLGQDDPTISDFGYGIHSTVADLGRIGQLLLNKGSYGDTEFFTRETFDKILWPRPLKEFFPDMVGADRESSYNLGWVMAPYQRQDTPEGKPPVLILGKNTLTHGSATGAVLCADFDHDLVIAVTRHQSGNDYVKQSCLFLMAVADAMK